MLRRFVDAFAAMIGGEEIGHVFGREEAEVGGVSYIEAVLESEQGRGAG
jgi:hypothetical protein